MYVFIHTKLSVTSIFNAFNSSAIDNHIFDFLFGLSIMCILVSYKFKSSKVAFRVQIMSIINHIK